MTDPTTTPTPTNERQDVRERAGRALYEHRQVAELGYPQDGYTAWDELPEDWQDEYREAADAVLAAVSAAVPDERGLPGVWETWQRPGAHPSVASEYAAMEAGWTAALAARPAPTVSGEAVEAAARRLYVRTAKDNTTHDEAVVPWTDLHPYAKDRWLDYARDALTAALGITVADAPAADDEGGQGR